MVRKHGIVMVAAIFLVSSALVCTADYGKYGKSKGYNKGWESKIFYKAHFMIKNQDELGLSDEQVKKIKELKLAAKKELIDRKAKIEILGVDIKGLLYKDPINLEAINALIDQKYEIKKAKTKYIVQTYANLKNILTDEQKAKLKTLWKQCKK